MKRVLVIDDDAAVQTLFQTLLSRAGFAVAQARNGNDGLRMLSSDDYAVVILDLMMPQLGGTEVLDRLRQSRPEVLKKVIIATGASHRMLDTVDSSPVHAVIRKPFDIDELLGTVTACATRGNA